MYEDFYRLNISPFRLHPDVRFLYWSQVHQTAYGSLRRGLDKGGGIVAVTGEVGTGKTTLVQSLLAEVDSHRAAVANLVSTQLDAENLVRALEISFGLPAQLDGAQRPERPRDRLAVLENFLANVQREGRRALIVIDEAQNLSIDALNELLTLTVIARSHGATLLQCALIGQPELSAHLDPVMTRRLGLPPFECFQLSQLDASDTRAYVLHRLSSAGWNADPTFEPRAFSAIFLATGGVPRRINSLCNRLLLTAFLDKKHRIASADVEETAAELRNEIGVDALPASSSGAERPVLAQPGAGGVVRPFVMASVSARLDSVDRMIAAMLKMTQTLASTRQAVASRGASPPPARPSAKGGWRTRKA